MTIQVTHFEWTRNDQNELDYMKVVDNFDTEAEYLDRLQKERDDATWLWMCAQGEGQVANEWLNPSVFYVST